MRFYLPTLGSTLIATAALAQSPVVADLRPRLPAGLGDGGVCALADLDGDGVSDLLRAEGERLRVLLQTAAGTFVESAQQPPLEFVGAGPISALAVGRFDADADLDVVVGLTAGADELLWNDGRGVLTRASPSPLPASVFPATLRIVAADLDGLGADDLLVLAANAPPRLLLAPSSGTVAFVDASAFLPQIALGPRGAADAADLDRDGDIDLVLGASALAPALVLWNDGAADFRRAPLPLTAAPARALCAVDLDRDGWPDIAIAPDGAGPRPPECLLSRQATSFAAVSSAPAGLTVNGWAALACADLDGDGAVDIFALQADGALLVGRGRGDGTFPLVGELLPAARRSGFAVGDLEGDGDVDLFAPGIAIEDALLIGDGLGSLVATEARTAPVGLRRAQRAFCAAEATGDGDPDLVLIGRGGDTAVWRNDGGGRFVEDPAAAPPVLPPGGAYSEVRAARFAPGGVARDLVVLGQPTPFHPAGVRLLEWRGAGYLDVSGRFPTSAWGRLLTAVRTATFGRAAPVDAASDVVVADTSGMVRVFRIAAGAYREIPAAVPYVHSGAVVDVLVGDVDGDRANDLVVLSSAGVPEVHVAVGVVGTTFREVPSAAAGAPVATTGLLAELTGDGVPDLLLAAARGGAGLALWAGVGDGTFVDATSRWLGSSSQVSGVVALARLDARRIAVGRDSDPDLVLARSSVGYVVDAIVPIRGSRATRQLLATDLDLDGDADLIVGRADAEPAVLAGLARQLVALGVGQRGRALRFVASGPAGGTGFVLVSPLVTRLPLAGLGILRLVGPATFAALPLPGGVASVDLRVPPGIPAFELPLQLVTFDPWSSEVVIANLELATITAH